MKDLSLHILDILENSAAAKATLISVIIEIDTIKNHLEISIEDNGFGMDDETLKQAQNPFYTSKDFRKIKVGMGIPLFCQNTELCNGFFKIDSKKNFGTKIIANFQYDHLDRLPLGGIGDTIVTSILGHSEIDYYLKLLYKDKDDQVEFEFETKVIKNEIGDIPLSNPDIITFINQTIESGIIKTNMEEI